ncbi:LysR family transcriptional regulator [Hoeflea prorocentri]|uniref:LysR family transcriptional regulator n=1 Tax=Hoeflea prorocentri TaxID=1922333 RepID=A0A9X3ZH14_9HYPH|nr:LysR family transcriptional regulator [Hoeflea prorocentri]MCY6380416.1 LysR family transcriptional regulator [Hoeflea prorocentri]MDA5398216.1 LysR family transcriptional regulator [Hoeflea prorocentri]
MSGISPANRKLSQNLVGLCAFDLVARHGNFTGAADALGMSQSAVSQRIKALEQELGVVLFTRIHRGVVLTNEGSRLLNVVGPAMRQMGNSVNALLERKSKPRVRLSADFAFSTFWLLPRLSQLRSELGEEIELQILASQIPPEDDGDDCDISIHVRPLSQMKGDDILLLQERVAAVCSPKFLAANGPITSSKDLLKTQLLSLSRPPSAQWQTWQGWFDALGIVGERSQNYVSFNNYDMVTQAAIAGDGVALGWLGLIDDVMRTGLLVQATDDVVDSFAGYIMSLDRPNSYSGPRRVYDWIAQRAGTKPSSAAKK